MIFGAQVHDFLALLPWRKTAKEQRALRALIEQKRRVYSDEQAKIDSAAIVAQIEKMEAFRSAETVMLYYPLHGEVDLRPLMQKYADTKLFLLPATHRHSMEVRPYEGEDMMHKGHYGVPEPQGDTYTGPIDLILVPGVVFDRHCHRIGRGGGFYDRFLRRQRRTYKIGVCYEFQLRRHTIPQGWFDQPLNRIVTPRQTIG